MGPRQLTNDPRGGSGNRHLSDELNKSEFPRSDLPTGICPLPTMNETPQVFTTEQDMQEIKELIEDTVQHLCDVNTLSGEFVWGVVECLSAAKYAQITGLID